MAIDARRRPCLRPLRWSWSFFGRRRRVNHPPHSVLTPTKPRFWLVKTDIPLTKMHRSTFYALNAVPLQGYRTFTSLDQSRLGNVWLIGPVRSQALTSQGLGTYDPFFEGAIDIDLPCYAGKLGGLAGQLALGRPNHAQPKAGKEKEI